MSISKRTLILFSCLLALSVLILFKDIVFFITYKPAFVSHSTTIAGPLVLDLDGDGIELYKLAAYGSYFDLDADGQSTLTSWIEPDDGLLAIDINSNGQIDNITELFGSSKINGFKKLVLWDNDLFFGDGVIDENDTVFRQLRIWRDINSDGLSQPKELQTLKDLNIVSISTKFKKIKNEKIAENEIRREAAFELADGSERRIVDAWFNFDPYFTHNVAPYNFDIRAAFLPTLRGFGMLKDLHIAISKDNDSQNPDSLISLVMKHLTEVNLENLLQNWDEADNNVENILFHWAGVAQVNPDSRGPNINARQLGFNEAQRGEKFRQTGYFKKRFNIDYLGLKNPMPYAAAYSKAVYDYNLIFYAVHLSMQNLGHEIFVKPTYSLYTAGFKGDLTLKPDGIEHIKVIAESADDPDEVWMRFVQIIAYTKGLANLSEDEEYMIDTAIADSDTSFLDWQEAITETEKTYGKIIEYSEDWNGRTYRL